LFSWRSFQYDKTETSKDTFVSPDRVGNIITELTCKGRMNYTHLEKLFNDRIEEDSIMCTDSMSNHRTYSNKSGVSLVQIKNGKLMKANITSRTSMPFIAIYEDGCKNSKVYQPSICQVSVLV